MIMSEDFFTIKAYRTYRFHKEFPVCVFSLVRKFVLSFYFSFVFISVQAQVVRFEIRSLPQNHDPSSTIYIAGSFNSWNPQDNNYKFLKDAQGKYYLELKLNAGSYEYKITRGGWDKVETAKSGAGIQNRQLIVSSNETVLLDIEEWQDRFPSKPRVSTSGKQVC